ncbi:TetR/AcrR family transcriptional regulator [Paenibacillus cremeus]|uniref:TetR/AcrR family transcriptional regulator n=1 Tax=Paenibacillus cremeus TaxID=2163881 RepID=A0A559K427_9BACL|nr:TetR/AcrR family transcriptional regulator [Paenibacillus cremeus]TVY06857.1 TetR/AcrR family transcriptional regulator [Paenibacillus cremeus]
MTARKIKQAALQLFARSGYDGVPLSEIAKAVGIKTPSLYAHFKSKDDLFLSVFEDVLHEHNERMTELLERLREKPVESRLYTILRDTSQTYLLSEEHMTFLKRTLLFPPASMQETLQTKFAASETRLTELLTGIFTEGIESGLLRRERPEDLVTSFYCLLDGTFIQQFYYERDDWEQRLQTVWRIFWQGLTHPDQMHNTTIS